MGGGGGLGQTRWIENLSNYDSNECVSQDVSTVNKTNSRFLTSFDRTTHLKIINGGLE